MLPTAKPGYGNCRAAGNRGKTNRVFPPFPPRLENSPNNGKFPTVPTASAATLKLHFQVEFANDKWKMENVLIGRGPSQYLSPHQLICLSPHQLICLSSPPC